MADYKRAESLAEALIVRAERDVAILAGGTDLYPARANRRAWGDPSHKDVLDIGGLEGLRGITRIETGWRLGALTTWSDLIEAALPAQFAGYQNAARDVGGRQVQNAGTLAGNICTASPAGDGIPCLMALDAEVELTSLHGIRLVPIASFLTGYRTSSLRPDEIVTALLVPDRPDARGAFRKLGARRYLVISIAMASAVIATDAAGKITHARLAVGACGPVAARLRALESALVGSDIAEAAAKAGPEHLEGLQPIDDIRASAAYRHAAALDIVRDVLGELAGSRAERAA
jgi:N-methylhydantoinase B